ncbi:MAG: 23S rRNA (pseudouridine1915-N3)-methyltransferase [Saprospiraceae bacterium]|jgi:23S rRNA (pseudouridine1915-N3)-methyltransferase
MNITCISIGKTKESEYVKFIEFYTKKLNHYNSFEYLEYPALKNSNKFSKEKLKEEEGKLILKKIKQNSQVILLDEKGRNHSSREFASYINKKMVGGGQEIYFIIGGAFGFSEAIYQRANEKIALSKMTFTHQMVRIIFLEQLYRAFSIIKGEKYHH